MVNKGLKPVTRMNARGRTEAAAPPNRVMKLRRFIMRNLSLASFGLELSDSFGRFPKISRQESRNCPQFAHLRLVRSRTRL